MEQDDPMTRLLSEICERIERLEKAAGIPVAEWLEGDADV